MAHRMALVVSALLCVMLAGAFTVGSPFASLNAGWWSPAFSPATVATWLCGKDESCRAKIGRFDVADLKSLVAKKFPAALAAIVRQPEAALGLPSVVGKLFAAARRHNKAAKQHDDASLLSSVRKEARRMQGTTSDYPFFGFLPQPVGSVTPMSGSLDFTTSCFSSVTINVTAGTTPASVSINVATGTELQFLCSDVFVFWGGGTGVFLLADKPSATFNKELDIANYTDAERWILLNHSGVSVFRFPRPLVETIGDVIDTVTLMAGFAEFPISNATMAANAQFLQTYVQHSSRMQPVSTPRSNGTWIMDNIDPSLIHSGDLFALVRYDGLDPMIGWGEGATAGHTTVAMRDASGNLHVCESTATDSYWKVNGIQCTPWAQWRMNVKNAQMNIVWAPLSPKYRTLFNATAAWAFFQQHEGYNYGYLNFLFGWIDLANDNFPCLPPDFKSICLTRQFVPVIATFADRFMAASPENIFRQALNFRAGTQDLPVPDVIKFVWEHRNSMTFTQLYTLPEQDHWEYNTTRYGKPSVGRTMVCCVFVCSMWKAAGIFSEVGSSEIQCTEQTIWDIASMNIFDRSRIGAGRPAMCQQADPDNTLCQISGEYTFHLKPDLNTRRLYKKMGEKCSSLAPDYIRRPGC